ncbi:hypothetical protein [Saccharopolyspora sp. NPDC002376]
MTDPRELLDELEQRIADRDDHTTGDVDEYRRQHPERVAAFDALRAVLDECTAMTTLAEPANTEFIAKKFRRVIARALDGVR